MKPEELRTVLVGKPDGWFPEYIKDFGGTHKTPDDLVRYFVNHPEVEPRLCHDLGLKTEAEKSVDAAIRSADAAEKSAKDGARSADAAERSAGYAKLALVRSKWGVIIAALALFVAILALVF